MQTLSVLCLARLYANTANTGQLEQQCPSGPGVPGQLEQEFSRGHGTPGSLGGGASKLAWSIQTNKGIGLTGGIHLLINGLLSTASCGNREGICRSVRN